MLKLKIITVFLIVLFIHGFVSAQGCSDAGACSIGSMDNHEEEKTTPKIKLTFEQSFGSGEKFIFISQSTFTFEHPLHAKVVNNFVYFRHSKFFN